MVLRAFLESPSLRVAAAFGLGGAAFSIANLILARALTPGDYGQISLVIGLLSAVSQVAPLGLDLVITRRGLALGRALRRATAIASVFAGTITAAVGLAIYRLDAVLLAGVLIGTVGAGLAQATAAHFQSAGRFAMSVPIFQSLNVALLVAAVATIAGGIQGPALACSVLAATLLAAGFAGWFLVSRDNSGTLAERGARGLWGEALALMAVTGASSVFLNLERFVIPGALDVEDLATFGVLAALVGSPFRMIQAAVSYTVVPRLRDARSPHDRRRLLLRETALIAAFMAGVGLAIWLIAPPLARWFLHGRYDLTAPLMLATLLSGVLKVMSAFVTSVMGALAPERGLTALSLVSWLSIGLATLAAFAAAPWGLVGVLYGVSAGWAFRTVVVGFMAVPYLTVATAPSPAR